MILRFARGGATEHVRRGIIDVQELTVSPASEYTRKIAVEEPSVALLRPEACFFGSEALRQVHLERTAAFIDHALQSFVMALQLEIQQPDLKQGPHPQDKFVLAYRLR